jgi:hypothetical protein
VLVLDRRSAREERQAGNPCSRYSLGSNAWYQRRWEIEHEHDNKHD